MFAELILSGLGIVILLAVACLIGDVDDSRWRIGERAPIVIPR